MLVRQEGKVDAVKLEGGRNRADHIRKIVDGGVAVVGHVGLTPQAIRCKDRTRRNITKLNGNQTNLTQY